MPVIERKRKIGEFAFKKIEEIKDKGFAGEYKSYARSLPSMIINNGLGNALAFELSKSKDKSNNLTAHGYLLRHIREFANGYLDFKGGGSSSDQDVLYSEKEFVRRIMGLDMQSYMFWTEQILLFLDWLRKFADGMIEKNESGD